ncbi:MAG: YkoP family protein [Bacillota bacterium]
MRRLIHLWDPIARKLMGIRPTAPGSIAGYSIRRYPGRSLTGADGSRIRRGERVLEVHIDSRLLEERTAGLTAHQRSLYLRREMIAGLQAYARLLSADPALEDVRGLWALTLIHRGVDLLGFTVIDLPGGLTRWLSTLYLKWILAAYHPDGDDRLHQREEALVPKEIFMSREVLLSRYGQERRRERKPKVNKAE